MKVNRLITNICSDNLTESKLFYTNLFDFEVLFDSDWFVNLKTRDNSYELGIISKTSDLLPKDFQHLPIGFYVTFVVDDADIIYKKAKTLNYKVIAEPEDTFYGQRRLLLQDPDGTLIDVSSLIKK